MAHFQSAILNRMASLEAFFEADIGAEVTAIGQVTSKRTRGKQLCWLSCQGGFCDAWRADLLHVDFVLESSEMSEGTALASYRTVQCGDEVIATGFKRDHDGTAELRVTKVELVRKWGSTFKTVKQVKNDALDRPPPKKKPDPAPGMRPKPHRAGAFASWLLERFGEERLKSSYVLDIAGGAGDLAFELWLRGIKVIVIDPKKVRFTHKMRITLKQRPHNLKLNYEGGQEWLAQALPQYQECVDPEFVEKHRELFDNASAIVGMHPDQATGAIVETALMCKKPCALVPCCVFSHDFPDRTFEKDGEEKQVVTYEELCDWIAQKSGAERVSLPFHGKNLVLHFDASQAAHGA